MLARVLDIDQNVNKIYHNKDIKFLKEKLFDIAVKEGNAYNKQTRPLRCPA